MSQNIEYYTQFPNRILDTLLNSKFSGAQFNIILAVIRQTIGFNRDSHILSRSYLAKLTGRHGQQIAKDVRMLLKCHVLIEIQAPTHKTSRQLAINTNVDEWTMPLTVKEGGSESTQSKAIHIQTDSNATQSKGIHIESTTTVPSNNLNIDADIEEDEEITYENAKRPGIWFPDSFSEELEALRERVRRL